MARQDNPFALLGEDDDGGDVMVLLAKVESKSSVAGEKPQPKATPKLRDDGFPPKPLPTAEFARAKRGRGRGDRGRGLGRGGLRSGSGEGADLDTNEKVDYGYSRGFGSDSGGRGRGRSGGRGARGRWIERGFYEHQGFDGVNQYGVELENQGKSVDWVDVEAEVQGKTNEHVENHGPIVESKFGDQHRNSGWEGKDYDHDNQHFRGGEGRGRRGFGGGRQGSRGGIGQRYIEKEPVLERKSDQWNEPKNKEDVPTGMEQVNSITLPADGASGWDMLATANVSNGEEAVITDQNQLVDREVSDEKDPKEEDNEMTLDEYEKVLQEKRKALQPLKIEERKVVVDQDFESMQLVEKKQEENFVKLKIEREKLKKDSLEKEERVRKSLSITEFLKPADGGSYVRPYLGRGRGGRGGRGRGGRDSIGGGYAGHRGPGIPSLHFDDPAQFPVLGAAAKVAPGGTALTTTAPWPCRPHPRQPVHLQPSESGAAVGDLDDYLQEQGRLRLHLRALQIHPPIDQLRDAEVTFEHQILWQC
ncbi:hypothetical protein ZIOFF_056330 [Zingiber officinale]|uniref:Hyaluronan/mRNA-binding protein domain-containing protein n=2 Tax=Zingiber officinale TaxID=94328 RepID=A0A8J5FM07_ZINOF|nr:hypothetical protein ZIOFF_056330 [Zingiber officinale]